MILQVPVNSWIFVGESAGGLVRQKEAMIDDIVDSPSWPKTSFENGHDSFVAPEIGNILTLIDSTLVIVFLWYVARWILLVEFRTSIPIGP